MRKSWPLVAALFATSAAAYAQTGRGNDDRLMSECAAPDLPAASVNRCLDRVRVREETAPSPELESLEAGLQQRASASQAPAGLPPGERHPYAAPEPESSFDTVIVDGPPRALQQNDDRASASPADPPIANGDAASAPALDDRSPPAAAGNSDRPSSDWNPEDEPPVADPPDDAAGSPGDDSAPPPGHP